MDILPSVAIFRELQDIQETGYISAQPSLEENWQQVLLSKVPHERPGRDDVPGTGTRCRSFLAACAEAIPAGDTRGENSAGGVTE